MRYHLPHNQKASGTCDWVGNFFAMRLFSTLVYKCEYENGLSSLFISRRITIQLIVSYTFWAVLFLLVFITIKNTRVRKYPFLFCGWAIFSQVYGFIPIAFRHTEETIYLVLSWCTNIFLIVLVFFTVKYLYNYYLISRRT